MLAQWIYALVVTSKQGASVCGGVFLNGQPPAAAMIPNYATKAYGTLRNLAFFQLYYGLGCCLFICCVFGIITATLGADAMKQAQAVGAGQDPNAFQMEGGEDNYMAADKVTEENDDLELN